MKKASRRYFSAVEDWWEHAAKSNAQREAVGAYILPCIPFVEQQCSFGTEPPLAVTVHHFSETRG